MTITAYPLKWPSGWPRTTSRERSKFGKYTFERMRMEILRELRLLNANDVIISSNLRLRQDGFPYSEQRQPEDVGIAVYFKLDGADQCIPCDKWSKVEDNLRAIVNTVEALRGIERWGAKEMVNAAFRGFKALPESIIVGSGTSRAWWEVLQVSPAADFEVVEAAYKRLLHKVHPDKGGTEAQFMELQSAFSEAKSRSS